MEVFAGALDQTNGRKHAVHVLCYIMLNADINAKKPPLMYKIYRDKKYRAFAHVKELSLPV